MIDAIVPIPNRIPTGTIIDGTLPLDNDVNMSGRAVIAQPLIFYKVFSRWNNELYEHVFATDEAIDPITLETYKDPITKEIKKCNTLCGILIPISVKQCSMRGSKTYLFVKSINYLMNNYFRDIPFATQPLMGVENKRHSDLCPYEHIDVASYTDTILSLYFSNCSPDAFQTCKDANIEKWEENRLVLMSPEAPAYIYQAINMLTFENAYGNISGSSLFFNEYTSEPIPIKDIYQTELYDVKSIDPITRMCLYSPTYILAINLKPLLSNESILRTYSNIAYTTDTNVNLCEIVQFNDPSKASYWYEIMEAVGEISDTDFSLYITFDESKINNYSKFNLVSNMNRVYYDKIINSLKLLLLNKFTSIHAYENLYFNKNWLDEIFISCKDTNGIIYTYYINMAYFHLISPSLINDNIFFSAL